MIRPSTSRPKPARHATRPAAPLLATLATLASLALLGCAGAGSATPPPPMMEGTPKVWVPAFQSKTFANGVSLHANVDTYLPMVSIAVGIRGGVLQDPPHKAGLTSLLAEALIDRSERLDRLALAEIYDQLGGAVRAQALEDGVLLQIEVLEDRAAAALKLLAELLSRPAFEARDLARLKDEQKSRLGVLAAEQQLCKGTTAVGEAHPDHYLLRMAYSRVAGGASRWLRGVHNVTYGVGSLMEVTREVSIMGTSLAVDAPSTATGLRSVLSNQDAQRGEDPLQAGAEDANIRSELRRQDALRSVWLDIEKVILLTTLGEPNYELAGRARTQATLWLRGLPFDHWDRLRQRLDELRDDHMGQVLAKYMGSDELQIVLVGDPERMGDVAGLVGGRLERIPLALD